MAENREAQLEKFEAEKQKHIDAIEKLDTQIQTIRAELRGSKLSDIQKQAAAYSFSPEEIFGKGASGKQKRATVKTNKRTVSNVKFNDDSGNTWGGGKGPIPKWITAIRDAKGDIEKYRVAP